MLPPSGGNTRGIFFFRFGPLRDQESSRAMEKGSAVFQEILERHTCEFPTLPGFCVHVHELTATFFLNTSAAAGRRHTGFPQTRRAMQIFAGRSSSHSVVCGCVRVCTPSPSPSPSPSPRLYSLRPALSWIPVSRLHGGGTKGKGKKRPNIWLRLAHGH